ncbi:hypothetical protein [Thalassobaculum sp.]|uniref:hypothetical protein n=1 Tax=Thalassobaculum sp. TaxID=2022740 RepID=UPI0032EFBBEB
MGLDTQDADGRDTRSQAFRVLGGGVGMLDAEGGLAGADVPFLTLHGVAAVGDYRRAQPDGRRWPATLSSLGSSLAESDGAAVESAWTALIDGASGSAGARDVVRLADGRALVIGCAPLPGSGTLLLAAEYPGDIGSEVGRGRLAHDVNNALGGMLAHLYLALLDLEADHPARQWVEAVNDAAARMREHLLQVRTAKDARQNGPASGA